MNILLSLLLVVLLLSIHALCWTDNHVSHPRPAAVTMGDAIVNGMHESLVSMDANVGGLTRIYLLKRSGLGLLGDVGNRHNRQGAY